MAELSLRLWGLRALFVALCGALILARLLPVHPGAGGLPWPDLLLAVTLAWVLRRPDHAPALAIAVVFLAADFLYLRPPGLWAALAVLAAEVLRAREPGLRDLSFAMEWALVAGVMAGMTLANAAVLALMVVDQPPIGQILLHLVLTALIYPLAAGALYTLGIRRTAPGDMD